LFLQHLSNYFWSEDLAFNIIGDVKSERIELLSKAHFLIGSGNFLSDDGGEVVKGDFALPKLQAGVLEEAEEAVSKVKVLIRGEIENTPESSQEGSDVERTVFFHNFLNLY
jgi:hypothetical protein